MALHIDYAEYLQQSYSRIGHPEWLVQNPTAQSRSCVETVAATWSKVERMVEVLARGTRALNRPCPRPAKVEMVELLSLPWGKRELLAADFLRTTGGRDLPFS